MKKHFLNWRALRNLHETKILLACFFLCTGYVVLSSEVYTLKTYYPSPYGSYKKFKVTDSVAAGTADAPLAVNGSVNMQNGYLTLEPRNCAEVSKPANGQLCLDKNEGNVLKVGFNNAWKTMGGGDSLLSVRADYANATTISIPVAAGADYAYVHLSGQPLFGSATGDQEESMDADIYADMKTGVSAGGISLLVGRGDVWNYVACWNGSTACGGASEGKTSVSVSGGKINVSIVYKTADYGALVTPMVYAVTRFYKRG
jgi:hypothetical protein